jgi:molybdate transport system regulatory protein/xanthine dehydrogenase accessory factor
MRLHAKIALANDGDEEFFGVGLLQLLEGIARHGSIHQAARDMELSYVKALKILNRLERELGETLLIRRKGGAAHGSTELTPFARRFTADFVRLRLGLVKAADRSFVGFRKKYGPRKQRGNG